MRNKFKKGNTLGKIYGFKSGNIPWNKEIKTPQETIEKIKENAKTNPNFGMKGKHHSEETKQKIREKATGRKQTMEQRLKESLASKGKPHSKEHNLKVSLGLKGKKKSNEHIINMTKANEYRKGKTCEEIFGLEKAIEIKKKMGLKGDKNNNWRGGKSFEPYEVNFNKIFKRLIRKRDNQVCMLCGVHREKIKQTLQVHHINYDKLLTIPENCISLCSQCHGKTNFNRGQWITLFQSLLNKNYSYQYENNLPIINLEVVSKL
jgi:hypothetical protein